MIETITSFITNLIGNPIHLTQWYLILPIAAVFGIYEAFWRRWFGGGAPSYIKKIPSWLRRLLFNIVNIVAIFAVCYFTRGLNWMWSLYATLIFQLIYWNYTFGMYMDIGRYNPPEGPVRDVMIEEYNEDPVHHIMDSIFTEKRRYGEYYDFFGMMFRYFWPLLFIFFVPTFNSGVFFIGPLVAFCYEMCINLKERNIGQDSKYVRDMNEYGAGLITGLYICLNGMF